MYNLKDRDPHEFFTVSFRCYVKHAQMVSDAAEKQGTTPADYARKVVLDWAASDLGLPAPEDYRPLSSFSATIAAVAKKQGITPEEYTRRAAAEKLERDLAAGTTEVFARANRAVDKAIHRADQAVRRISGTRRAS